MSPDLLKQKWKGSLPVPCVWGRTRIFKVWWCSGTLDLMVAHFPLLRAAAPSSLWCLLLSNPPPSAGDHTSIGDVAEIVFAPWLQSTWDVMPCSFLLLGPAAQRRRRWFVSWWTSDRGPVGSACTGRPVFIAELGLMHGVTKTDWQICREQLSCVPYVAWLPLGDLKRGEKIFCWKRVRVICILGYF